MRIAAFVLAFCGLAGVAEADPRWRPKDGDKLDFDITRNGGAFGRHVVTFRREGDRLHVSTDVQLKAGIGPLTLFDYRLASTESYDDGQLVSVGARTLNGGKWHSMTAQAVANGLQIEGEKFKGVAMGIVSPSSHWNIAEMKQAVMLSLETGQPMKMQVADLGVETVKTASGVVSARRFRVTSDIVADFWYDLSDRWVKCAFTTQGNRIEYTLRD